MDFTYSGSAFDVTVPLTTTSVSATLNVTERLLEVSGSVTKSDVRLLETPQSISVIGRESLTEQAPLTVQDALRYSAGIRTEQYGFDARGDCASIPRQLWPVPQRSVLFAITTTSVRILSP